jgi:NADPH:quinone reductase-like Zn-dependent oxidoreductase
VQNALKENGLYTSSGEVENLFFALVTPLLGGKKVPFIPPKNITSTLKFILDLIERGRFKPLIDRKYPLDQIAEAFTYVASGQKLGNVVVTMDA